MMESGISDRGFIWEDTSNHGKQRKFFTGGFGPHSAAKDTKNILEFIKLFFNKDRVNEINS
jgi:hypothetical protein